ncbi:MAG: succinate--CoA ligase subunit alpha [Syntrophaceae bacterium CG2_30_49_12]|nr:MAG: succinate--CoA ligase subunit alpha [Syntrophaceae bacterium CG2_30_49_12]PIP06733.1 MAG: succinate--CoA ligase subunit alpha [Syntrophobacterales bacterium CG23_combo_of_CG06-09_8_20_14_all_48_27]PJA48075.1 MAG: succinate--CoA ligase subunit alpha [Syntrophobacterales bacterium CG_4_9_14_3_um_filter_49_8]PJC76987.1 MAG: succinate--CoA ligase subunit alpha [Syntrophobacterales bacterium CG_4_8_14_3_um_filter_49_14]
MAILFDKNTRVVSQGITGTEGSFHTRESVAFGTRVVAGVTPGKGGMDFDGIPIYNRVIDAVKYQGVNASGIYTPASFAPDAILEAIEAGVRLIVCVTEGIPVLDMIKVKQALKGSASRMIGPNCPGITTPGAGKIGFMPNFIHKEGNVGLISRSGTLTYEVIWQLTSIGIGQSTSIGIGGDPIVGTTFVDLLGLFEQDPQTGAIVLIGEIGGTAEEEAAEFIKDNVRKPVVAFIAGQTAPPGRRMGHAGAIIAGGKGTSGEKVKALEGAGVIVEKNPAEIGKRVGEILTKR